MLFLAFLLRTPGPRAGVMAPRKPPRSRTKAPALPSFPHRTREASFREGGAARVPHGHPTGKPFRASPAGGGRSGRGGPAAAAAAGRRRRWGGQWARGVARVRRRREAAQSPLPAEGGRPCGAAAQPGPPRAGAAGGRRGRQHERRA